MKIKKYQHLQTKFPFEPIRHWKDGKDSGFSWCCVVWFLIRGRILRITGYYIDFEHKLYGEKYSNRHYKVRHVLCPFHAHGKIKKYYTCKKCEWVQYGNKKCVKCQKSLNSK